MRAILLALAVLTATWRASGGELLVHNQSYYTLWVGEWLNGQATYVEPWSDGSLHLPPGSDHVEVYEASGWEQAAVLDIPDDSHNWEIYFAIDLGWEWSDLGAPGISGYSQNIVGSIPLTFSQTEGWLNVPLAGFTGGSPFYSPNPGLPAGVSVSDYYATTYTWDGSGWYDDAGSPGFPYAVPGSPIYVWNVPESATFLFQGEVSPGPGQSASLWAPAYWGMFSSIYPLDNYPLDLPTVEGAQVSTYGAGFTCLNGQWYNSGGTPQNPSASLGAPLSWLSTQDLYWTQTSPEPARAGDGPALTIDGPSLFLNGDFDCSHAYTVLGKPNIMDTNWLYNGYLPAGQSSFGWTALPTGFFQAVDVAVDNDADGIPDWWELTHSGNPLDASDANADPDHDGISSYDAYQLRASASPASVHLVTYTVSR